jgi:hypothetical protein
MPCCQNVRAALLHDGHGFKFCPAHLMLSADPVAVNSIQPTLFCRDGITAVKLPCTMAALTCQPGLRGGLRQGLSLASGCRAAVSARQGPSGTVSHPQHVDNLAVPRAGRPFTATMTLYPCGLVPLSCCVCMFWLRFRGLHRFCMAQGCHYHPLAVRVSVFASSQWSFAACMNQAHSTSPLHTALRLDTIPEAL